MNDLKITDLKITDLRVYDININDLLEMICNCQALPDC
jgi:hypothetical protein